MEIVDRTVETERVHAGSAADLASAAWALGGVCLLFAAAVVRLSARGLETLRGGLEPWEWGGLLLLTLVFVVGEGWGALQRRWVPRLVDRARALRGREDVVLRVLAPLYGMSLIAAPPERLLRAWAGSGAVVTAILVVREFPDPWRGIVDLAVAAALVWGMGAILIKGRHALA